MTRITSDFIERHFGGRFLWVERDCCSAACNAFFDLWGIDPMETLRGRYDSEAAAIRLIAEHGGLPALAVRMAWESGLTHRLPYRAHAGDIALLDLDSTWALGLAVGDGRYVGKTAFGWSGLTARYVGHCWGLPA